LPFKDKIEVEWKSFQLDPTLPVEGASQSTLDYLVNRKGMPKEQIEGMMHHLDQSGAAVGIEFRQDIAIPVNTFRAHRLIHFAQSKGKGNEMEEALFFAHFTAGKNVGNLEVLTDLATSIGLNKDEVVALLQSEEQTQEVKNDIEEAQALGISGVPFFVVDRKYGISGAQPIDTFAEALTQAYEESQPKFEMKGDQDANACGPDGCEI